MEAKQSTTTISSLNIAPEDKSMMVHVTAPSTLPAGYAFDAHINDDPSKVFTCEVPVGGVTEGQVFLAPLSNDYNGARINAPTEQWKDGLCDCCTAGFCHPSLWCSWCCFFAAMGQVMTRMQLTWLGGSGSAKWTKHTFLILVIICIVYQVFVKFFNILIFKKQFDYAKSHPTGYDPSDPPPTLPTYYWFIILALTIYRIIAICRTRRTMRERYQIRENCFNGCEDCCCATWCTCCVVSQMLRHTGEYENYRGVCCSKTGHPPGTPLVV